MVKILSCTFAKADLNQVADNTTQLNYEERTQLLSLLEDLEECFDCTLGDWATVPVNLELKPGYKPFTSRYYRVTRTDKNFFHKELRQSVEIGVLTRVQHSQDGCAPFIIPKKEGTMRFITNYHRLNQKLARKPYPLPIIGKTMQQQEGFHYATSLDLNMGYYTIRLSPDIQEMTTIVTEFGKYRYNCLPTGMRAFGYIFQSQVENLLGDIK